MEKVSESAVHVLTVPGVSAIGWSAWVSRAPQFGLTQ